MQQSNSMFKSGKILFGEGTQPKCSMRNRNVSAIKSIDLGSQWEWGRNLSNRPDSKKNGLSSFGFIGLFTAVVEKVATDEKQERNTYQVVCEKRERCSWKELHLKALWFLNRQSIQEHIPCSSSIQKSKWIFSCHFLKLWMFYSFVIGCRTCTSRVWQ